MGSGLKNQIKNKLFVGSKENRLRKKWQDYSGKNATNAEQNFLEVFRFIFEGTDFQIRQKPKEFEKIYVDYPLDEKTLKEIYTPEKPITRHGVFPDDAIDNTRTNKTIYVEVKRQYGWVEGKEHSDRRGNAHERSCKFFTPGLQKIFKSKGNLGDNVLPFWTIFQGDITRDPCRVREITCWYDDLKAHYFFWRDSPNPSSLIAHFETHMLPLLI